jgi:hypothetical protein
VLSSFVLLFAMLAPAPGQCAVGRDDIAAERLTAKDATQADLLVAMAMSAKLAKVTPRTVIDRPSACARGDFAVGKSRYILLGDDGDGMMPRRARAAGRKAPVAYLLSTIDMKAMLASAKGGEAAGTVGYALMTSNDRMDTGWAFYRTMPSDATLRADMARALAGKIRPIFRTDRKTNKTAFVVG